MSSRKGEAFEKLIRHILNSAGFTILKFREHRLKINSDYIGDLDVLALDPKTNLRIGVSCKEYHGDQKASSEEFSHFISMLEHEGIKHGIFAVAKEASGVIRPRITDTLLRKNIRILLLEHDEIEKLESLILMKDTTQVEEYFRKNLFLDGDENSFNDNLGSRKQVYGKTVKCENLLPINFDNKQMPEYIVNGDEFSPTVSTLYLEPYFVLDYGITVEARHPQNFEILDRKEEQGTYFIDASKGRILHENEPIYKHLENYCTNYVSNESISEFGFSIQKIERRIDFGEFIKKIKNDIASRNEIRKDYVDSKERLKTKIVKPKGDQVHILSKHFIYVPIWEVEFHLGDKSYKRKYFAYDGESLTDELIQCNQCKKQTHSVCTQCFATSCEDHQRACMECAKILCSKCARICVDCGKIAYCKLHVPKTICHICKAMMCATCSQTTCRVCNLSTCWHHRNKCSTCSNLVCLEHQLQKKYTLVTKKFCTSTCLQQFDDDYNSSSKFGKFKKILGR